MHSQLVQQLQQACHRRAAASSGATASALAQRQTQRQRWRSPPLAEARRPSALLTRRPPRRSAAAAVVPRASSAAAAGAQQPQQPPPQPQRPRWLAWLPDRDSARLLSGAVALLRSNLWAVVLVFAAKDAAAFVLHRLAHRLTNYVAEVALAVPVASLGNPWWILPDPRLVMGGGAEAAGGAGIAYQALVALFFLLCLPLNVALNTAAVSTAAVVCATREDAAGPSSLPSASFAGRGGGKVGLAECRPGASGSSLDGECPVDDDDDNDQAAAAAATNSSGFATSTSGRPATPATVAAAAAAAMAWGAGAGGMVTFRGGGGASFGVVRRGGSAASTTAAAATITTTSSSSSSIRSSPPTPAPPARAAPMPWLSIVQQPRRRPQPPGPRASAAQARAAWAGSVAGRLGALWRVDLLFNLWALPLQAACLAVLPAPWALPRLLAVQLALPAAALGGLRGRAALDESRRLMAGRGAMASYAWPFAALIALGRLVDVGRELALVSMPARWWTDVIEVPLLVTAAFAAARVLLLRALDLLPLAAYLALAKGGQRPPAAEVAPRA